MDMDSIAGILGLVPQQEPTVEQRERELFWKLDIVALGFDGDDNDARLARKAVESFRAFWEFLRDDHKKNHPKDGVSKLLTEAIAPMIDGQWGTISKLVDLAVIRITQRGLELPEHPRMAEADNSRPAGHGWMPPISDAG